MVKTYIEIEDLIIAYIFKLQKKTFKKNIIILTFVTFDENVM